MIREFFVPSSCLEAVQLKKKYADEAYYIAGGTELNSRKDICPSYLISLGSLGLNTVHIKGDEVWLGAMLTCQDLIENEQIKDFHLVGLLRAARNLVNIQIRNMATLAGNIVTNRSCSDIIPVMMAYRCRLEIVREDGKQELVAIEDYVEHEYRELIRFLVIQRPSENFRIALRRYSRSSNDLAVMNVAVGLDVQEEKIERSVVAVGGVARHVKRLSPLEQYLSGLHCHNYQRQKLQNLVDETITPITDIRGSADFKKYLCKIMVADAVEECLASSKGEGL